MTSAILGVVAAVLSIVAMILKKALTTEKTRAEKVIADAESAKERAVRISENISKGKLDEVKQDMDDLVRRIEFLRLHAQGNPPARK